MEAQDCQNIRTLFNPQSCKLISFQELSDIMWHVHYVMTEVVDGTDKQRCGPLKGAQPGV